MTSVTSCRSWETTFYIGQLLRQSEADQDSLNSNQKMSSKMLYLCELTAKCSYGSCMLQKHPWGNTAGSFALNLLYDLHSQTYLLKACIFERLLLVKPVARS